MIITLSLLWRKTLLGIGKVSGNEKALSSADSRKRSTYKSIYKPTATSIGV